MSFYNFTKWEAPRSWIFQLAQKICQFKSINSLNFLERQNFIYSFKNSFPNSDFLKIDQWKKFALDQVLIKRSLYTFEKWVAPRSWIFQLANKKFVSLSQ